MRKCFALLFLLFSMCLFSEIALFDIQIDDPNIEYQSVEYYVIAIPQLLEFELADHAREYFKKAKEKYPDDVKILLLYGDILYHEKDVKGEHEYYTELIKLFPNDYRVYLKRYYPDRELNKYKDCIQDLLRANELCPLNIDILGKIGLFYLEIYNFDLAEKYLLEAYACDDKDTSVLNNLASLYLQKKEYEKALDWVNMALEINSENSYSYRIRGYIYKSLGKEKESKEDFARVKYEK